MTDRELLAKAIKRAGYSARAFARVLAVNERTVRRWLAGEQEMTGPARQLCRAIVAEPSIAALIDTPR